MLAILLTTYAAVFVAEIVGDKLLYTTGILATRYHKVPILCGVALALMVKMGAAVAFGQAVARLPLPVKAAATVLCFLGVAYTLWQKPDARPAESALDQSPKAAVVSFTAILFSEWGDVGQITAAAMAARYDAPLIVWLGASAAMVTKGVLAAYLGAGIRASIQERISPRMIRYGGVSLLLILGALTLVETLERQ
jgi:Ca2+/H+ antiporter, TMEM165/GDT1 family